MLILREMEKENERKKQRKEAKAGEEEGAGDTHNEIIHVGHRHRATVETYRVKKCLMMMMS